MKIGLVSPYDYSFPGGVVNHISHLARHFSLWGHDVKIIAPCLRDGARYFEEEVTPVGRPFPIPNAGSMARVPISPWLPTQIKDILSKEKFEILHIHEPFTPMLSLSALLRSPTVNVGTFHAFHSKPRGYWVSRLLLRRWAKRLHGKIAVSRPAMEFVSRHIPADYRIIPNGIEIDHFSPDGPRIERFIDNKLNILFVGRLEKRKGLDFLLHACAKIRNKYSDFRLIVVGPGTKLRHGYEDLAKELGLDNIVFTDWVSFADLPAYYRTADICCAPATGGESFGIVLLEAMATGKPVVATNIEGYSSVMTHDQEGLLVPVADPDSLSTALLTLLEDKTMRDRMGTRGIITSQQYGWEKVSKQILNYYDSLLSK
jgi:phosphatidylinositol alpha-mannosyltransferase